MSSIAFAKAFSFSLSGAAAAFLARVVVAVGAALPRAGDAPGARPRGYGREHVGLALHGLDGQRLGVGGGR